MKLSTFAAAAALAVAGLSAPVLAQNAAATVGAKVFGPDGAEVGTIEKVDGGTVIVNTGSVTAALPADAIGTGDKGLSITLNKAELEAAVNQMNQQAAAALEAKLVADAEVYSSDGVLLGKVQKVEGDLAVVELSSGVTSLPKAQMAVQNDKLTFLATAADVEAAMKAQGGD